MAAEFRPKTGCKLAFLRPDPTPALAAVVGAAATASLASAVSILRRRRIIPPSPFSVPNSLLSASPHLFHFLAGLTGGGGAAGPYIPACPATTGIPLQVWAATVASRSAPRRRESRRVDGL